jgi:hypothetical protein
MKRSLAISMLIAHLFASTGLASTDDAPHVSPCGRFRIANIGDTATMAHHFQLRRSDGPVIFEFKALSGFDLPSFAENIVWSHRGEFVALSVSTGKYLRDTLIIATGAGRAIRVPTDDWDYQTRPVRWTSLGELVVETKSPFGGKGDDGLSWDHYRYRRTLRIRDAGSCVECVYTGRKVYPYRAGLLREGYKPRRSPTANKAVEAAPLRSVPHFRRSANNNVSSHGKAFRSDP